MVGGYAYWSEDNDTSIADILDTASMFCLTASATSSNVQFKQYIARRHCIILVDSIRRCSKPKSSYTVAEPKLSVIRSGRSRAKTQGCAIIHCPRHLLRERQQLAPLHRAECKAVFPSPNHLKPSHCVLPIIMSRCRGCPDHVCVSQWTRGWFVHPGTPISADLAGDGSWQRRQVPTQELRTADLTN